MNQSDNKKKTGTSRSRAQAGSRKGSSSGRSASYQGQAARMNAATQARKNTKRKRRPEYDITKIIIGIAIVLAVILCVGLAVKAMSKEPKLPNITTDGGTQETELKKEVAVDGISITGLSREDAKKAIMTEYEWGMKVAYKDQEHQVTDLMGEKIDTLLQEIYSGEPKTTYTLDTAAMDAEVTTEVAAIAAKWDVPAKNGSISSYDKQNGKFVYAGEQTGIVIDQDKLAADIKAQLSAKEFKVTIQAEGKEVAPTITEAQAKELYKVVGSYATTTTANKDRNKNIELAAESMNGLILQPGHEFSFNDTTGERSEAKGYRPAGAYSNGILVEEPGGGVCQVSSTLYNAVVFAGLKTTERHAHSYEPSYVTPGEDAMVSYGGPDMKFINTSDCAVAIRTSFSDRKLTISIVAIPILEPGVVLSMTSKKVGEVDPPAPTYEEDQTLELGVEKVVKEGGKGSRWTTNLVTKKDGQVVSDEFFHNSTYRGKPGITKRNTSGTVVPPTESATVAIPETTVSPVSTAPVETSGAEPEKPAQTGVAGGPGVSTEAATQPQTQPTTAQGGTAPGMETTAQQQTENSQSVIPPNPMGS